MLVRDKYLLILLTVLYLWTNPILKVEVFQAETIVEELVPLQEGMEEATAISFKTNQVIPKPTEDTTEIIEETIYVGRETDFSKLDLNEISGYTEEDFNIALERTPLAGQGNMFADAEANHGINGLFLAALTGVEQSFGRADSGAMRKNNLTSFNANDASPTDAIHFETFWECIDTTAKWIKEEYITVGGKYYNGTTVKSINKRYASSKDWEGDILFFMYDLENKIKKGEK